MTHQQQVSCSVSRATGHAVGELLVFVAIQLITSEPMHALPSINPSMWMAELWFLNFTR